jgi:hypothetical protein
VIDLPKTLLTCVVGGVVGLGTAPTAVAESPCLPDTMAMSPQPVLSCPGHEPMPFPKSAPLPDPAYTPAEPPPGDAVQVPAGAALPPPGQAPHIPPVTNQDGSHATFEQGTGVIGDLLGQFGNGVPTDLLLGPPKP